MQFRLIGLALLFSASTTTQAQNAPTAQTPVQRFLSHFDLGVSAAGILNGSVSGQTKNTSVTPQPSLNISAGNTVGALVTLRGQKSPYIGGELNFSYSRYADTYTFTPSSTVSSLSPQNFRAQSAVNEFTIGYVARPPHPIFGAQPYVGAGAGSVEFKPTKNGGSSLPVQARAAYYYHAGLEKLVYGDFGVRAGVRQIFFLAPDYGQNYLTLKKYTSTFEPTVGFYYHF